MKITTMLRERLNARQVYVLEQVSKIARTSSGLANDIISTASLTKAVDCLEERGLVTRVRSKADRRQVFIEATKAGKELLKR